MKKTILTLVLAAVITCGILYAENKKAETVPTKPAEKTAQTEVNMKDVSYCIGMDIARAMKAQDLGVDAEEFSAGFKAAYAGTDTRIAQQEAQVIMEQFNTMMREKMAKKMKKDVEESKQFMENYKTEEGVKSTKSGLLYKVIKSGEGKTPTAADTVTVNYRGTLTNGKVFDSSYKRGKPATFPVTGVIPGWTEILQLMQEGDKWEVVIPSELAYGKRGAGNMITPDSILVFEIELIKVESIK